MAAPKHPNPGPAAIARRKIGDQKAAQRLTKAGYQVIPPTPEEAPMDLTALQTALASKFHGSPVKAIPETINAINQLPTVGSGEEADALSGPWYVNSNAECANPEDVEITICRGIESRNANDTIRIPGNYETSGEVNAALLRAQAMCAGLNLTSATNGITS